jgi:hypothetical protein
MPTRNNRRPTKSQRVTVKVRSDPHLAIDVPAYRKEAQAELNRLLDVMGEAWGYRPAITLKTETCLVASADFHLKGFAHKGSRSYIRPQTANKRNKPKEIARRIVSELVAHRDTCKECGEGLVRLWLRVRTLEAILRPRHEGEVQWYRQKMTDAELELKYVRPADAVERACFPRQAAKLDKLIAEWHEAHAPKPEPLEYVI